MTTILETLENEVENLIQDDEVEITPENMVELILDFSIEENTRLRAISLYHNKHKDEVISVFRQLVSIFSFAPTRILQDYFVKVCKERTIAFPIRLETMLSVCSYQEADSLFTALVDLCEEFDENETVITKRIETSLILLRNKNFYEFAVEQIIKVLDTNDLDPEYRYKTVLSLKTAYDMRKTWVSKAQKEDLDIEHSILEKTLMTHLLENANYDVRFRILAGQFLLVKYNEDVCSFLLEISRDEKFDYNHRADATDVVLRYGNPEMKKTAGDVIMDLARNGAQTEFKSIYENAQNAHTKEIEISAINTFEKLGRLPLYKLENGNFINFEFVEAELSQFLNETAKIAMNRIRLDNALYGNMSMTLKSGLVCIYSFILTHEAKALLIDRLCEELSESANICSTGIMERMVNTFSGIVDELSIRISYEDEIMGALSGRLNNKIMNLSSLECLHKSDQKFCTCIRSSCEFAKLFISGKFKVKTKTAVKAVACGVCPVCSQKDDLLKIFSQRFLKITDIKCAHKCSENMCNDSLIEQILEEMTIPTRFPEKRQTFLKFFRKYFPNLFEELQKEYEKFVDGTTFDLIMKKAILVYEGENF